MNAQKIDTVFLDAGGVLCHPSWTRVADALVRHGAVVTASRLAAAEQKATRDIDDATVIGITDDRARGWLYFNLVLQHAGVEQNEGTDAALISCANITVTLIYGSTSSLMSPRRWPRCAAAGCAWWLYRTPTAGCGTCSTAST